ncbi:hypothetical protein DFP72DRAFT_863229 [Ephemerocybe angulata]|uniref:Mug135-like C-terminal domain-containing protein n=1 Tax=Ephemerocybe angulata TaxID=980116 RepID=A0A8H6LSI4_9AGAR|nr:hypothetical protein DFP72DRAFT_863229 [Tulosesus angulatus]
MAMMMIAPLQVRGRKLKLLKHPRFLLFAYPPRKTIAKSLIDGDGVGNADVDQRSPAWATAMMETIERSNATFGAGIRSVNARIDGVHTRIDGVHTRLTRLQGTFDSSHSTRTLVIKSLQASAKHLPPLVTSKDILNLNYNDLRSYAQGYGFSPLPTPSDRRASEWIGRMRIRKGCAIVTRL